MALLVTLIACDAAEPIGPSPDLIATWDGPGGVVGGLTYAVALSIRVVSDSVQGDWRIVYDSDRAPDEGTFGGAMEGDELVLLLRQTDCAGEIELRLRLLGPGALGPGAFSTLGACPGPAGGVGDWVRHELAPPPQVAGVAGATAA
jgi:hypothetical protein